VRSAAQPNGAPRVRVSRAADAPSGWDALAAGAGFFHGSLWTECVARHVPGVRPLWLVATLDGREAGGLAAVERRRGPFRLLESHFEGTAGGPVVAAGLEPARQDEVAGALLDSFRRLCSRPLTLGAAVALTPDADARWGPLAARAGLRRREVPAAVLDLAGGVDAVEYGVFPKNRRNERNRALRRGLTAGVTCDAAAALDEFYGVYLAATRRWATAPVPLPLLRDLLRRGAGAAFLSWVRWEGRVIGGHFNLHAGPTVTAWVGATLPEHNDKFPATLLIGTDIEEACRRGAARLDLGGSGGIAGVAKFKELLGAGEEIRARWETAQPAYRLWSRLRRDAARRSAP
jgi:CelD/BcsL family acetyltransferase involved in cellulose biosynthesis